jgi:NRPS condensation-like uncharacterized protein
MAFRSETARNENNWYKLDNAAKIYPAISGPGRGSVFRVAVRLKQEVDPEVLQKALAMTLPRFPTLAVKLKKGLFWYYFETHPDIPAVIAEKAPLCRPIETDETNGFLFRVSYYRTRINLEMFHALTDGTGALAFLKSLTFQYLTLSGCEMFSDGLVLDCEMYPTAGESEDSFGKYYDPRIKSKWMEDKAYHVYGSKRPQGSSGVVHGILPVDRFKALAKEGGATVTEYIAALITYSIYTTQLKGRVCHTPVKISVPVNLRNFFPSETLRNFSSYVNVGVAFTEKDYGFEQVLDTFVGKMKQEVQPEKLIEKISANVKAEKNIFMRIAPLAVKNVVLRTAFNAFGEKLFTCTFSNLGIIRVPDKMRQYVDRFEIILGPPVTHMINCTACTYENDLIVTFARAMYETDIERFFFRFLSEKGLDITIETNDL